MSSFAVSYPVTRASAYRLSKALLSGGTGPLNTIQAQPGSFVINSPDAGLLTPQGMSGAVGAFTITGRSASLLAPLSMSGATGTFTIAGAAAALTVSSPGSILAGTGVFVIIGDAMTPVIDYRLPAAAGAYTITGNTAALGVTGGGGAKTITMTSASAQNGSFGALSSFSMAVGSYNPATDDLILFAGGDFSFSGTAPTIGGVVASIGAQNADNQTAGYYIPRGSGVSVSAGNVTVAPAGSYSSVHFAIGYVTGATSGTPTATTTALTGFASPHQISGTVASGGVGVAYWHNLNFSNLPVSWLPAGWSRVAASEASQSGGNGSQGSAAIQATPTAGTYTLDSQNTGGAYAFMAFV